MGRASNRKKTLTREQRKAKGPQTQRYEKEIEVCREMAQVRSARTPEEKRISEGKALALLTLIQSMGKL